MNLKGGVLIIGSLIWDKSPTRTKWRKLCLIEERKIYTPVKIRYGRRSTSREDTYSMIFSNHPNTEFGQGLILPFKDEIKNFLQIEKQSYALAKAEGIWKESDKPKIYAGWGTVGILFNPKIDEKSKSLIIERWIKIYENYKGKFEPKNYINESDENQVIDENGVLKLEWVEEMKEFDFLLATPVKPRPRRLLSSKEIAQKMIDKNYFEYFEMNNSNQIFTFQDEEIKEELKRDGSH
jgi:hypothetical protein